MSLPLILSLKRRKDFYGSQIKVLSPAKINLYLNIIGKYPGGYHRIESVVERISLCDEISVTAKKGPAVNIFCADSSLGGKDNLCVRAAQLIKQEKGVACGFDIFLRKNIPVGAGLGGGSSNAASTLLAINALLDLKLGISSLYQLGAKLGSDVNFFLSRSSFAFISGRGEHVFPFSGARFDHLVFWPGRRLSTKKVYKNTHAKLTKFLCNAKILRYALSRGDAFLVKKNIFNVLERSALSLCSELRGLKNFLQRQGIFSKVTGSGSALYTLAERKTTYKKPGFLPNKKWLVFKAQTF